tara:strand:- start:39 stop:338 length:300 start_codon:yes stop_codon:yes gene_type:complete
MKAHEIKNIKVNRDDIFNFVVKNSNYDPIERCIDCKSYEVFDEFIYNNKTKETIEQEQDFVAFSTQVSRLRFNSKKMNVDEILRICEELEEIAPKYIKL